MCKDTHFRVILHYFLLKLFQFTINADAGRLGKGNSNLEFRGRLLPFGQWVFDKSRGQLNIIHTLIFFFEH